jgi:hypothetical protein
MNPNDVDRPPSEDPLAELERQLISAYVADAGHDLGTLLARHDEEARKLLAGACRQASEKLSEVESRLHYLRKLHGSE